MSAALHLGEPQAAVSPSALSFQVALGRTTLPPNARLVGNTLARQAYLPGRGGQCQVTVGWLAEQTGYGASTVRTAIDHLQAAGVVEVIYQLDPAKSAGGRPHHAPNLYRLRPEGLRALQRPRPARTYLPELGNVSDEPQADLELPHQGTEPPVLPVEDPPPTVGGGSSVEVEDPPPTVGDKETSPKETKDKGGRRAPRQGREEASREPSQPPGLTPAWVLERYRASYEAHYDRPPVVMVQDRTHAAVVLTAAREQAQHQQQRLARDGREVPALEALTAQCVEAWLERYLARTGSVTTRHPEGYLRGQGHPLGCLGQELNRLGTPWDGSRTPSQPSEPSQPAARGEASTVSPSQALDDSIRARVWQRSQERAVQAARLAAREAAHASPTSQDQDGQGGEPGLPLADEPTADRASEARGLAVSEPVALQPVALQPTSQAAPPTSQPTTEPPPSRPEEPASLGEVVVAGLEPGEPPLPEADQVLDERLAAPVAGATTGEDPAAVVAACRSLLTSADPGQGGSEAQASPQAASELVARLPALCSCPTPAPTARLASALGSLGVRLDQGGPPVNSAGPPVGPGRLAFGARPARAVTERHQREAQERHDERVAWAVQLWPAAAAELVQLAAAELGAARRGDRLPPQHQRRLSELSTQAARARPKRQGSS